MNLNRITASGRGTRISLLLLPPPPCFSIWPFLPSLHSTQCFLSPSEGRKKEKEKNRLRFLRPPLSPLCFLSASTSSLLLHHGSGGGDGRYTQEQFGIGMSAILILGIGRIPPFLSPSLPPFYMAAQCVG